MGRVIVFFRSGRGIFAFAGVALGWMILVVLEGAVVRATGSGAGCGDHWPLCNGQILPHHPRLATVIEFTHRSMTGICSGLVLVLLLWTFLAHGPGTRVRKAAVLSGLLLFTEALLGAILVLGHFTERNTSDLRVLVQSIHFTNTMLLLAALGLAWWWQRRATTASQPKHPAVPARRWMAAAALLCMLLTGATGSVAALADTLFPAGSLRAGLLADFSASSPLLVRMRWMHPAASAAAFLLVALLAWRVRGRGGRMLAILLAAQLVLGGADVLLLAPIVLQVLHLLGADLLWIALVLVSAEILLPAAAGSRQSPIMVAPQANALSASNA